MTEILKDICFLPVEELGEVGHFGAAVIGAASPRRNRAHKGVFSVEMTLLRLGWPVGGRLGTLSHVQKALGLGRPAFKEAIAILEARGLLVTRPGPGGGLFVGAPTLEDVMASMLMHLALTGASPDCVAEFRQSTWRMIVAEAIQHRLPLRSDRIAGQWGFAVDLAEQVGNDAMRATAQLAEMLARICGEPAAPTHDGPIQAACLSDDLQAAWKRIDALGRPSGANSLMFDVETVDQGLSLCGRKSAVILAVRMAQDLRDGNGVLEAEWETAKRLGRPETVVREARRILQDYGVLRCQQGIKGAAWTPPANAGSVIRVLAPFLVASGISAVDNRKVVALLASTATVMAARRVAAKCVAAAELRALLASEDFVGLVQFENALLDLGGNPLLAIMIRAIGLANLFVDGAPPALPRSSEIMGFNQRIVQAIEAGDASTAGEVAMAKSRMLLGHRDDHSAAA